MFTSIKNSALKAMLLQFQDGRCFSAQTSTWDNMTWSHSSMQKSKRPHPGTQRCQSNSQGWGRQQRSNAPHMPGVPPPLGINIDTCITYTYTYGACVLTYPAAYCKFIERKGVYIKELSSYRIDLVQQHGRPFIVLECQ